MLAPYSNERTDLLNIVDATYARELEHNPNIAKFVRKFLTLEIMPLEESKIEQELITTYDPFLQSTENSGLHLREFLRQLIQHNIRVIEKYYCRIRLNRLASIVGVSLERAEVEIGDMVVNKRVNAKINRMNGIVVFNKGK